MVPEGPHHADELAYAPQAIPSKASNSTPACDMASIGRSGCLSFPADHAVAAMGTEAGVTEPLLTHMRLRGDRCWKVDLCRLLNTAAGDKVIDDRQLRRHSSRGGHRFLDGRFINIPKYIAWIFDEVHAPSIPKRLSSRDGTVTTQGILHVIEKQSERCALTGRHLVPEDATLDHNLPTSRGGKHTLDNIQILHRDVNRAKSTLTNDEFIALCREVVAWADRKYTTTEVA